MLELDNCVYTNLFSTFYSSYFLYQFSLVWALIPWFHPVDLIVTFASVSPAMPTKKIKSNRNSKYKSCNVLPLPLCWSDHTFQLKNHFQIHVEMREFQNQNSD